MRFFLALLLILPLEAFAQKRVSAQVFQGNVRPILSAILNDFYQMITHFPNFPRELISVVDEIDELHGDKELLREKCPRHLNKQCLQNIDKLKSRLSLLNAKTLTLMSQQKMAPSPHINILAGIRITSDFYVKLEEVKGILDNTSLMIKAEIPQKEPTYPIIKKLDELSTLISLTVVEYVPFAYKEDFRHFYFNFVHPVQQQIAKNKNYEFMNRNINSLNFALNLLNQNLTKRNKKTPEGMSSYLSLIHNRWNGILRNYY